MVLHLKVAQSYLSILKIESKNFNTKRFRLTLRNFFNFPQMAPPGIYSLDNIFTNIWSTDFQVIFFCKNIDVKKTLSHTFELKKIFTLFLWSEICILMNGSQCKSFHRKEREASWNIIDYRFSAFWLRSKCSICSYQLNIWYEGHVPSSILNWFLTGDGGLGACTAPVASWPSIAVPLGSAHGPTYRIKRHFRLKPLIGSPIRPPR